MGRRSVGDGVFRRELNDHEDRLQEVEKSGGGFSTVNEPEEGLILSVNEDGDFEWIEPPEVGAETPRVLAAFVNGTNAKILASYTNGPQNFSCEHLGDGTYWFKYATPFTEPEPSAAAPPFISVVPVHPLSEEDENIVATIKTVEGFTNNGAVRIELRKLSDGALVDANFFLMAIGPFS